MKVESEIEMVPFSVHIAPPKAISLPAKSFTALFVKVEFMTVISVRLPYTTPPICAIQLANVEFTILRTEDETCIAPPSLTELPLMKLRFFITTLSPVILNSRVLCLASIVYPLPSMITLEAVINTVPLAT